MEERSLLEVLETHGKTDSPYVFQTSTDNFKIQLQQTTTAMNHMTYAIGTFANTSTTRNWNPT